jgi:hypothetical protein
MYSWHASAAQGEPLMGMGTVRAEMNGAYCGVAKLVASFMRLHGAVAGFMVVVPLKKLKVTVPAGGNASSTFGLTDLLTAGWCDYRGRHCSGPIRRR